MKKTRLVTVILFGLCAAIWSVRVILDAVDKSYAESPFIVWMNALCAVLWIVCFIVNLKRYLSEREK